MIENPVLRGFNPDPSFVRVGDDYYIATSTFEWFGGVQLHHSRDLVHWRLLGQALTRASQLDLRGVGDSSGVWAPSLSHHDGQFWLIYTNVRSSGNGRPFKDVGIYLVTAPDIQGPWSDPVVLNSIGFDPSLFHDDDGRKYLLNMIWDFRKTGVARFAGIVLQEYDHAQRKLVGPMHKLLQKEVLCEGPNLYKKDGWYYLMMAEGGTNWNHGISMARSRSLTGPYELDPQEAVITSRYNSGNPLQKAGHGELIQTPSGEWWLAHLAARPVGKDRRCILGRETCLQRGVWSADGWLRLAHGGMEPALNVTPPAELKPHPWPALPARDDFEASELSPHWSSLRIPVEENWLSLKERPGWLRLRGRESLHSYFYQSFLGRRMQTMRARAETRLDFAPDHYTQMAGLACWYDARTHYYLRVTHDENSGRVLGILQSDDGAFSEVKEAHTAIGEWTGIYLRAELDREQLQFFASPDGAGWRKIGPVLDATRLSDDYGPVSHFTGAFFGLCAHDVGGTRQSADFDYFELSGSD